MYTEIRYNHARNTLKLIYEIKKCKFLIQILMVDFVQFLALLSNFYFSKGDWALVYVCTEF